MKKKQKFFLGFVIIIVMTIFSIAGCDLFGDDNPFEGTWTGSHGTVYFESSSWTINVYQGGVGLKGTYTYNGNTATITYTQISTDGGVTWRVITSAEASNYVRTATISGNTLTWGVSTYTRQ